MIDVKLPSNEFLLIFTFVSIIVEQWSQEMESDKKDAPETETEKKDPAVEDTKSLAEDCKCK